MVSVLGTRRVRLIGLDLRWFRSPWQPTDQRGTAGKERYLPDTDPAKTMLGEAQWRWLAAQLRAPADVRLLVSSMQCVVEGHRWERWGNLPAERERLYRVLRDTGARGVRILSGDAWRHERGCYRLREMYGNRCLKWGVQHGGSSIAGIANIDADDTQSKMAYGSSWSFMRKLLPSMITVSA